MRVGCCGGDGLPFAVGENVFGAVVECGLREICGVGVGKKGGESVFEARAGVMASGRSVLVEVVCSAEAKSAIKQGVGEFNVFARRAGGVKNGAQGRNGGLGGRMFWPIEFAEDVSSYFGEPVGVGDESGDGMRVVASCLAFCAFAVDRGKKRGGVVRAHARGGSGDVAHERLAVGRGPEA